MLSHEEKLHLNVEEKFLHFKFFVGYLIFFFSEYIEYLAAASVVLNFIYNFQQYCFFIYFFVSFLFLMANDPVKFKATLKK